MALGAIRPSILWMVLRSGGGQVAIGVCIGTALSLAQRSLSRPAGLRRSIRWSCCGIDDRFPETARPGLVRDDGSSIRAWKT
jgi:hypothetical protein